MECKLGKFWEIYAYKLVDIIVNNVLSIAAVKGLIKSHLIPSQSHVFTRHEGGGSMDLGVLGYTR